MPKPVINVTPLIDVLLVLLIIFMVVSPLKPTDFKTKIPQEPKETESGNPNPYTLIVTVGADSALKLNEKKNIATIENTANLSEELKNIFRLRAQNGALAEIQPAGGNFSDFARVEKTVFIKAPKRIGYGSVVKVIDAVKLAGADPIGLQIDDLEN